MKIPGTYSIFVENLFYLKSYNSESYLYIELFHRAYFIRKRSQNGMYYIDISLKYTFTHEYAFILERLTSEPIILIML